MQTQQKNAILTTMYCTTQVMGLDPGKPGVQLRPPVLHTIPVTVHDSREQSCNTSLFFVAILPRGNLHTHCDPRPHHATTCPTKK